MDAGGGSGSRRPPTPIVRHRGSWTGTCGDAARRSHRERLPPSRRRERVYRGVHDLVHAQERPPVCGNARRFLAQRVERAPTAVSVNCGHSALTRRASSRRGARGLAGRTTAAFVAEHRRLRHREHAARARDVDHRAAAVARLSAVARVPDAALRLTTTLRQSERSPTPLLKQRCKPSCARVRRERGFNAGAFATSATTATTRHEGSRRARAIALPRERRGRRPRGSGRTPDSARRTDRPRPMPWGKVGGRGGREEA